MNPAFARAMRPWLKEVSRSFYLTLRMLPGSIQPQISLAYLLARTTDTIADTDLVPLDRRLAALRSFRDRLASRTSERLDWGELARCQGSPGERRLLEHGEDLLGGLEQCHSSDRRRLREVLEVITSGQELDLARFSAASARQVIALKTEAELEDYTYRVAGCVGEFWTHMCRDHVYVKVDFDESFFLKHGVLYGKGLQLVNILRDLPVDLQQGRCYLPADQLQPLGLQPADLLSPASESRLRPVYQSWLNRAEEYLRAGWSYACALPRSSTRIRLACAWPIMIGLRTLEKLRSGPVLEVSHRLKVSRAEVYWILLRSLWIRRLH